jgi:hypothetical protein
MAVGASASTRDQGRNQSSDKEGNLKTAKKFVADILLGQKWLGHRKR